MKLDLGTCRIALKGDLQHFRSTWEAPGPGWAPPPLDPTPTSAELHVTLRKLPTPTNAADVIVHRVRHEIEASSPLWRLRYAPAQARAALWIPEEPLPYRPGDGFRSGLRTLLAYHTLWSRGANLHGALVVRGGRGVVALGPGGAGKTTFANRFPWDRVLADDLVVIRPSRSGYWGFGTPFRGREGNTGELGRCRLSIVALLDKSPSSRADLLSKPEAVAGIVERIHAPGHAKGLRERALRFAVEVAHTLPVVRLGVCLEEDPWSCVQPILETRSSSAW